MFELVALGVIPPELLGPKPTGAGLTGSWIRLTFELVALGAIRPELVGTLV
ncbi:MAG TPA: hypothetical protein VGL35_11810 [Rhizomicrobium sp.]